MSSFWLYSFERYNGLLESTNNKSIELQRINRFVKDNTHLHLLSSMPSDFIGATKILCHAVIDHVSKCVSSSRHLDAVTFNLQSETEFVLGIKYTIASFSPVEMRLLSNTYQKVYPSMFTKYTNFYFPHSYCRMILVTINGQTIRVGQFVWTRCVIPFPDNK